MNNNILSEIEKDEKEIIENRRLIHGYAEIGFDLDKTVKLVCDKLSEYGIEFELVGKAGVSCLIGNGNGKAVLLRADMDALTMPEENDLKFKSQSSNSHMCGHDAHAAMLLGAAKYLKKHEDELDGYVKLMFQPAEEQLAGAKDMIDNGILNKPKVDRAIGLHISAGDDKSQSNIIYYKKGGITYSGDALNIKVLGREAHGSQTYLGVDAIVVASTIVLALQNIVSKELEPTNPAVVLVGKINGGTAVNTLAGEVVLEVSVRAIDQGTREYLMDRVKKISENIASSYNAKTIFEHVYGVPPLVNDGDFTNEIIKYSQDFFGNENIQEFKELQGSEDFCLIASLVPSTYFFLGVGNKDEEYSFGLHHSKMMINESSLKIGSAFFVNSAMSYLRENK